MARAVGAVINESRGDNVTHKAKHSSRV